jgi:hypothetical protein
MNLQNGSTRFRVLGPSASARRSMPFLALLAAVLALAAVMFRVVTTPETWRDVSSAGEDTAHSVPLATVQASLQEEGSGDDNAAVPAVAADPVRDTAADAPAAEAAEPVPSAEPAQFEARRAAAERTNRLLRELQALAATQGEPTPAQTRRIAQALQQLADLGASAVPSLSRFLQRFEDTSFTEAPTGEPGAYPTLRLAIFDVLAAIGSPEAEAVLAEQLQMTGEPTEVAALADILDDLAPGLYRDTALRAARETLAFISKAPPADDDMPPPVQVDGAPLFQVLQTYPDESTAAELERLSGDWGQYAVLSLGHLPDEQGTPGLIRMIQSPSALNQRSGQLAMRVLAQSAVENPTARNALLDKALEEEIPDDFWPLLAEVVAGDHQLQMEPPRLDDPTQPVGSTSKETVYATQTVSGRYVQKLYSVHYSGVLSATQVDRRLELLEQLADETDNPAALGAIHRAESLLLSPAR